MPPVAHELPRGRQQILQVTVVTGTDVVWSAAQHSSEELQGRRMPWQVVGEHGMTQIPGLFGQQPGTWAHTWPLAQYRLRRQPLEENERNRKSTSAQSLGWAVTEDREGATPAGRRRGSDEVLEHPDREVGDPSQFAIIDEKCGGSLFQAGGDLQRVGGAEAVLGSQLSGATRCRPVKRGDDQVGIVGEEDLVFLRYVWSPQL